MIDVGDTEEQNIISFCSGYGGLEIGIKRAGLNVRTRVYVEIEAFAAANLVDKIEKGLMDTAPVWTDLKTFDGLPFRGKIHGIIAGYPCQPFSNAEKRAGTEDPRHLFPYILEHIRTIKPVWCFFENVSGHLSMGFDEVYKCLEGLDYSVEAGLFTASEIGRKQERRFTFRNVVTDKIFRKGFWGYDTAPHKRERLFILAYTEGIGTLPGACELANYESKRAQGDRPQGEQEPQTYAGQEIPVCSSRGSGFPARPGQEQYNWECPRTLLSFAAYNLLKGYAEKYETRLTERQLKNMADAKAYYTAKSRLGGTANGDSSRVDRLRLCGNGVYPDTAAKAFKYLWGKANVQLQITKKVKAS